MAPVRNGFSLWILTLVFAATLPAQSDPSPQPQRDTKPPASVPAQPDAAKRSAARPQPAHLELAPVSTADAARSAAREIAKRQSASQVKSADSKSKTDESLLGAPDSSAVDEFKSARHADSTDDAIMVTSKESRKSGAKNVHGTAYGSLDPAARGNHQTGASAGATSKGGKTSVYVETDNSRAVPPSH